MKEGGVLSRDSYIFPPVLTESAVFVQVVATQRDVFLFCNDQVTAFDVLARAVVSRKKMPFFSVSTNLRLDFL